MVDKKLKKPRNLTVVQWGKMKELAEELAEATFSLNSMKHKYELQLEGLRSEKAAYERAAQDKNATINRQSEDLSRASSHISNVERERDRIVRLCDQFLSVQIIGHGQLLNPTSAVAAADAPKSLRRT